MWQSLVLALVGFCGVLLLLKLAFPYLAPFFIGLLLALLLDGPISFLEGLGWPRRLVVPVLVLASFLGLPLLVGAVLIQFWRELQDLPLLSMLPAWPDLFSRLPLLDEQLFSLNFSSLLDNLLKFAVIIPDLFLIWIIAASSAYFFCRDKQVFSKFAIRNLPRRWRRTVLELYQRTAGAFGQAIRVQLQLIMLAAALSTAAFYFLNLPYPLLFGLLAAFFDLMPILGPGLIYGGLALALIWQDNLAAALALGLTYLVLLLIRHALEPRLIGAHLGLHPLAALLSLYVGLRIWGIMGALLGPIIMVFVQTLIVIYPSEM